MRAALTKQTDTGNEQLLKLYWNRAVVKRELKTLQSERHYLLEKLKEQEDEIVRAKEQLDGLERLLVNPAAAANAMVYFQLRHMWRVGAAQIAQFAADLVTQREQRERARLQEAAVAKRQRRLDAVESTIQGTKKKLIRVDEESRQLERRLESMNRFIKLLRGPGIRAELGRLRQSKKLFEQKIEESRHLAERIEGEALPEPEELSLESRRAINAALIALAQHLALHFSANNLVSLAKTATERSVGDMKFGDRRECDRMVESIRERIADLNNDKNLAQQIRERAALLARDIHYRNENSAVPTPMSTPTISPVTTLETEGRRATDAPVHINVIGDDYFDLSQHFC